MVNFPNWIGDFSAQSSHLIGEDEKALETNSSEGTIFTRSISSEAPNQTSSITHHTIISENSTDSATPSKRKRKQSETENVIDKKEKGKKREQDRRDKIKKLQKEILEKAQNLENLIGQNSNHKIITEEVKQNPTTSKNKENSGKTLCEKTLATLNRCEANLFIALQEKDHSIQSLTQRLQEEKEYSIQLLMQQLQENAQPTHLVTQQLQEKDRSIQQLMQQLQEEKEKNKQLSTFLLSKMANTKQIV